MSKLFSGDFNSLTFEPTRLILAYFVRRGTAGAQTFQAGARVPAGPRPRAATASDVHLRLIGKRIM